MTRREISWFVAMAALTLLVSASAPAFPQAPGMVARSEGQSAPQSNAEPDSSAVEEILKQQEQLIEGKPFSYDPGGRRDPFQSLFTKVVENEDRNRLTGVKRLLINELDLNGIIRDGNGGDVAYFTGPDSKGYFLHVGEQVYDGTIIAIDSGRGHVTFRQQVDDPRRIKPYRDIVRRLVPSDEESGNE